ncbi:hypothetical protein [Marinobacter salarius]|uniref:hypothetical protein n=1 Tax=Marinobacter salarius TaxID=1420917 RepID=UPI00055CE793|nr:hypothetical protein [Marinobacter salarius]AZR43197.1 hypothetical protein MTMN5_03764 [Marinobacter salarius]
MTEPKEKKGVGKRHSLTDQAPEKRPAKETAEQEAPEQPPGKPDFDQKDQNISPYRKAPGPGRTSRPASESLTEPETGGESEEETSAPPEAIIDEGTKGRKGKKR